MAPLIDINQLGKFTEDFASMNRLYKSLAPFVALADEAVEKGYTRPEVVAKEENCLIIKQGKFDIKQGKFDAQDKEEVVPNDTYLDKETNVEVLEGVNSGGKTWDMKKALYIAIRALSGAWVPAEYAKVSIRDKIIFREKGTGDTISAFQQDCKNVKEATPPPGEYWLVALDESFTSTEHEGAIALTCGFCRAFNEQGRSKLIISSHYPELYNLLKEDKGIKFSHFTFEKRTSEESQVGIVFPHEKYEGPLKDYNYALIVANTLNFDPEISNYAKQRLNTRRE